MLEEKIYQDYLTAFKERNKHRTDFLSFIRAELKNAAFDSKKVSDLVRARLSA
jgi:uncharacterized protein YqeY